MDGKREVSNDLVEWIHRNKLTPVEDTLMVFRAAGITNMLQLLVLNREQLEDMTTVMKVIQRKKITNALEGTALAMLAAVDSSALEDKATSSSSRIDEVSYLRSQLEAAQAAVAAKDREICELKKTSYRVCERS